MYGARTHRKTNPADTNREQTDIALLEDAFAARKPVLAICYGTQLLNVYRGGTLVQDIATQLDSAVEHDHEQDQPQTLHPVRLTRGRVAKLSGRTTVRVNSSHHQSIRRPGRGLRITARSSDGVVEAIEGTGSQWLVGVQWHPERMPPALPGDRSAKDPSGIGLADALFSELVTQARASREARMGNLKAGNGVNIQSRPRRKRQ
jgi:putative glutamine amidotransferase